MGKLTGKIALITGGNSGIGLSTAKEFVAEGAYVYITGRRQEELDAAVAEIGHDVTGVQGDAANLGDLDRLYAHIASEKGRVDIVFANAGVLTEAAPIGYISESEFDRVFNINVRGLLFTVQKALPLMPDGGAIVLNASLASIKALANFSVYAATKAAVRSFARTWAADLKDRRIRVNALSPGYTETPIFEKINLPEEQIAGFKAGIPAMVPLGRLGRTDEIAKAAVFLASDDSSYVTGAELFVDGGVSQI